MKLLLIVGSAVAAVGLFLLATASSRFRRVNSASVRSRIAVSVFSSGVVPSRVDRTPISMISPMMDETGERTGLTLDGNFPRASWSFSATICRSW